MVRYTVGYNMPGYMPDSEPSEVDSAEGAVSILMFSVECELIGWTDKRVLSVIPDEEDADKAYNKLVESIESLVRRNMQINDSASVTVGDWVFWIVRS